MLETLVALLAASVLLIPLSRRAGVGSVVGYLVGGVVIGPAGLRLVTNVDEIRQISELGVVMLLFLIGLELRPQRLVVMRKSVFGLGTSQVVASGALLAGLAYLTGIAWAGAVVLGAGLALSSTAIVLPMLAERNLLGTAAGRDGFAVLLFQDLAFIPLVALIPLLAGGERPEHVPWLHVVRAAAAVLAILLGGRFLIRSAFRAIGGARTPEVFTALSLLTVVGAAALASVAGLSMSLGAFLGGVLLSDSEYRHELQADIEPFEGLLLGFFFMSVGMSANLALAVSAPWIIAGGVAVLLIVKTLLAFAMARIGGQNTRNAVRFGLALGEGSEFSFVLFGVAVGVGALSKNTADNATLVVALSMVATPILFAASERFLLPRLSRNPKLVYDKIRDDGTPVIICGFGRVGQVVGRVLKLRGIPFTALDKDSDQVEVVRRFGTKVYFGDPTRPELLRAAGAESAQLLVVALDDMAETLRVVEVAGRTFPKLQLMVRARNRRHAHLLMDRGVKAIVRETFYSSLHLSEMVLEALDVPPAEARRAVEIFREHDEQHLIETHAFYDDERQLIQSTQQAAAELAELFEADRYETELTLKARPGTPKADARSQTSGSKTA
jgi:monovalent cation:proton antiporter-2 (CPA2) family protein